MIESFFIVWAIIQSLLEWLEQSNIAGLHFVCKLEGLVGSEQCYYFSMEALHHKK